jgi:hypothetical protein
MNSWCSRCALLTSATWARHGRQQRDLARVVHAQLDHGQQGAVQALAQAQQGQRHADVVVEVARGGQPLASPSQARRMAAIICVTVVLPLLPVTAISGRLEAARQPPPAAQRQPGCRPPAGRAGRPRQAAFGQRRRRAGGAACGRKSWASKRSPRSATNRSPGCRVRVSVCTREDRRGGSPDQRGPGSSAWAWPRVIIMRATSCAPRCASARAPGPRSRTAAHAGHLLVVLVALAGQQHHVGRRRPRTAWRMAGRRSRSRPCGHGRPAGQDLRQDAAGSRCAGCRWSAPRWSAPRAAAMAPISGRLVGRGCRRSRTRTTAGRRAPPPAGAARAGPCPARRACGRSPPPPAARSRPGGHRCMRPGTGVRPLQACGASASGTPSARRRPARPAGWTRCTRR